MSGTELEIKRLLTGDEAADRLVAALGAPVARELRQVNTIFDADDGRLARAGYMIRLRREDDGATLTAKGPQHVVGESAAARAEAEAAIAPALADELLAGAGDPHEALRERAGGEAYAALWRGLDEVRAGAPLRAAGSFDNLRRQVPVTLPSGLELTVEVDCTRLPGGRVDHELEIELADADRVGEVEAWLERLTAQAGVATAPSSSKLSRFLEALERDRA